MSRIQYINRSTAPPETAELFARMEANGASVLNLWQMAAHSPATLPHLIRLGNSILSKTSLDPKLRELAILRQAEVLGCSYEITAHTMFGRSVGMTDRQITAIKDWRTSQEFNRIERAVLRFTDEIVKKGKATIRTFSSIEKLMSPQEMMELTVTISFYQLLSHILLTFEVDAETTAFKSAAQIVGR
jgi:4-carboxymuconolactone decarboxylase